MSFTRAASNTTTPTLNVETTLATITTPGKYQLYVDLNAMLPNDIVIFRVKVPARAGGTKRLAFQGIYGPIPPGSKVAVSEWVAVVDDSDFTLEQTAGTARAYPWSVVKDASQPFSSNVAASEWQLSQANRITFVMIDAGGSEVTGLGSGFTLQISKSGGAFAPSAGTKAEIGNGWYTYLATAGEADTVGPLSVKVTGTGAIQQNLEYVVKQRNPGAIGFTYTVTNTNTGLPVEGVAVWVTTDAAGVNVLWRGDTDSSGIARDDNGSLPYLDAGVYQFWSQRAGYTFNNPDQETVS